MQNDQDLEPRGGETVGDAPAPISLPSPTIRPARNRWALRRWLIVAAVVLCLGAAATVLAIIRASSSGFASATDLMNALKARGVTCSSETPTPQQEATSAITCDTQPGHYIIVEVYASQTAADSEYGRDIRDFQTLGLQGLGLTEYVATGNRWVVHGDDGTSVQLAAKAFNGRYRVATP